MSGRRTYVIMIHNDAWGREERVSIMVDYGPKQIRIDLPTQKSDAEGDDLARYRGELDELSRTLAEIVRTPGRLRWTFD